MDARSSLPLETEARRSGHMQRGFAAGYAIASFGSFFAIMAPTQGGLAVKVQQLAGIEGATQSLSLLMGVGYACGAIAQPVIGRMSDRTVSAMGKRKPWLIAGSAGLGISLSIVGFTSNLVALLVFWCLAQICMNAVMSALHASVADSVPENRLGLISGLGAAAVPVAIMGSVVALDMLATNEARLIMPGAVGAGLCLVIALFFRDTTARLVIGPASAEGVSGEFVVSAEARRGFWTVCVSRILIMFGYSSVAAYLVLYFAAAFGMSVAEQLHFNVYATAVSVATMLVGAIGAGALSDRVGQRRTIVAAAGIFIGIGVAGLAFAPAAGKELGLDLVLLCEAFIGLGFGTFVSVGTALGIDFLPDPSTKARDLGFLNLSNSVPGIIGPFFAATFVIPFGERIHQGWGFGSWFVVAGVLSLLGGLVNLRLSSKPPRKI